MRSERGGGAGWVGSTKLGRLEMELREMRRRRPGSKAVVFSQVYINTKRSLYSHPECFLFVFVVFVVFVVFLRVRNLTHKYAKN